MDAVFFPATWQRPILAAVWESGICLIPLCASHWWSHCWHIHVHHGITLAGGIPAWLELGLHLITGVDWAASRQHLWSIATARLWLTGPAHWHCGHHRHCDDECIRFIDMMVMGDGMTPGQVIISSKAINCLHPFFLVWQIFWRLCLFLLCLISMIARLFQKKVSSHIIFWIYCCCFFFLNRGGLFFLPWSVDMRRGYPGPFVDWRLFKKRPLTPSFLLISCIWKFFKLQKCQRWSGWEQNWGAEVKIHYLSAGKLEKFLTERRDCVVPCAESGRRILWCWGENFFYFPSWGQCG